MPAPDRRYQPLTVHTRQQVQAFTIERPDGVSLMLRVLPGGSWMLREYDCHGDEAGRGDADRATIEAATPKCPGKEGARCAVPMHWDHQRGKWFPACAWPARSTPRSCVRLTTASGRSHGKRVGP